MRSTVLHSFLLASALAFGCGEDPLPAPSGPSPCYAEDPSALCNPFPDARLFVEGKGLEVSRRPGWAKPFLAREAERDASRLFDKYAPAFSQLEGFGGFAPILVPFTDELDPASLKDERGEWRFLYLEQGEDGAWHRGPGTEVELPEDAILREQGKFFALVRPSLPLRPGARAYLVLLEGVRTRDGRPLVRSAGYHREATTSRAFQVVEIAKALDVPPKSILLSMPVVPPRADVELLAVREWAVKHRTMTVQIPDKTTDPTPYGTFVAGTDDLNAVFSPWRVIDFDWVVDNVGRVVIGRFGSRDFRGDDGVWVRSRVLDPATAPEVMLDFVLTLPKGPRPPGGWPVVIGSHGINGRNSLAQGNGTSFCINLAGVFADAGLGCIGIDAIEHGKRGAMLNLFAMEEPRRTRDAFRQSAVDLLQLASLVGVLDVDGDGAADLDPAPRLLGNSLGSLIGSIYLSLDDRVPAAVLNMVGGGLSDLLLAKNLHDTIGVLFAGAADVPWGSPEYDACYPLLRTVMQNLIEPGDPVHYAHRLAGRRVLVQMGLEDRTIPNFTTDRFVALAGLPELVADRASQDGVAGIATIDAAAYGLMSIDPNYDPHNVFWSLAQVRNQVTRYLSSLGTEVRFEPP